MKTKLIQKIKVINKQGKEIDSVSMEEARIFFDSSKSTKFIPYDSQIS